MRLREPSPTKSTASSSRVAEWSRPGARSISPSISLTCTSGSRQRSRCTHQCSTVIRRGWSNGTQQRTSTTAVSWACAMRNHSRREVRYSSAIPPRSRKYRSGDHGDPSNAPNPFLSFRLIQVGAEDRSSGLAHPRRRSCSLVGAAGMAPPAPGCAHVSGAAPTPVGGDGQLCGT